MGSDFDFDITLYRGAGAYICGEETALLESLEGKRGQPRLKPPFPAVAGLYASPTLINNVETLAALPPIVEQGADWYAGIGTEKSTGTKLFSVSGHVVRPGNYEIVMGDTTLRELLYDIAGGFRPGRDFAAAWVGGSSVNVVGPEALDTPLDYESLADAGTSLGCAGCIVMDDSGSIVRATLRLAHFYRHESCGKCTPCREGMLWLERILERIVDGEGRMEDLELIESLGGAHQRPGALRAGRHRHPPRHQRGAALPRRLRAGDRERRRPAPRADDGGRGRWVTTPPST